MGWDGGKATVGRASRVTVVSVDVARGSARVARLLVGLLLVVGMGTPAWAESAGVQTVAQWRRFLAAIEELYDARAAHAVATFYAAGASAQVYLLSDCQRPQTVGELSAWLRTTAPPELTLLQALQLNAREHECEPRDPEDTDAEPAIEARQRD
jgi:hypothetical protein